MAVRHLHIYVSASIDNEAPREFSADFPISPDYTEADVRALVARKVEDVAFLLNRREFGRRPTLDALIAATARLFALRQIIETIPNEGVSDGDLRQQLEAIFALTNDEAIAQYGEDPDGPG